MLCPKCHRPLEDADDGVYICCAGAVLQWRCVKCAKVSEGFAFPYGRCPHCSGDLELLPPRSIDDEPALEGIRKAFEIELGGQAFYRRAAVDTREPLMKGLFGALAEMEHEHMQTLSRRYHADVPDVAAGIGPELAAIFGGVEHRPDDPANLFRIAIALENRAAGYFAECADRAPEGSAERELYRELAAEEREHAQLLGTEYARWQVGKPGMLDAGDEDRGGDDRT